MWGRFQLPATKRVVDRHITKLQQDDSTADLFKQLQEICVEMYQRQADRKEARRRWAPVVSAALHQQTLAA